MSPVTRQTEVREGIDPAHIPFDELMALQKPVILKGVARDWPAVRAGREAVASVMAHLQSFDGGRPLTVYTGAPEINGRFFYTEDMDGLNFSAGRAPLSEVLQQLQTAAQQTDPPSIYVGSTDLDQFLPGFRAHNDLNLDHPMFETPSLLASIWIGNRTTATAHFDMSNNLAVCVAGRRRFTLFPPAQVANLYPGPLEPTPGGQVVSMVDFTAPDYERFPRFRDAVAAGEVAELEAGDVLFYPALWWHHVEALEPFNILVNYWWNRSPTFMDTPMNTLLHGLLSLRDRPQTEKDSWRSLFDYYVFGPAEQAGAHLPEAARGALGPMTELKARRLRAQLLNKMNR